MRLGPDADVRSSLTASGRDAVRGEAVGAGRDEALVGVGVVDAVGRRAVGVLDEAREGVEDDDVVVGGLTVGDGAADRLDRGARSRSGAPRRCRSAGSSCRRRAGSSCTWPGTYTSARTAAVRRNPASPRRTKPTVLRMAPLPLSSAVTIAATLPAGRRRWLTAARRGPARVGSAPAHAHCTRPAASPIVPTVTARLPALDGLRAVAALLVVATHAAYLTGFTVNGGLLGRLAGRGDFGVAIFFALSGFLLHHGLVADARDGRTDLRAYAVRRAARVLPAYWVTLAVSSSWRSQPPLRTVARPGPRPCRPTCRAPTSTRSRSRGASRPRSPSTSCSRSSSVLLERARRRTATCPCALLVGSAVAATWSSSRWCPSGTVGEDVLIERWLPARWPNFAVGMLLAELRPATAEPVRGPGARAWRATPWGASSWPAPPCSSRRRRSPGPLTLGPVSGAQLSVRLALSTVVAGLPARTARAGSRRRRTAPRWPRGRPGPWARCPTACSSGTCRSSPRSTP